MKRFINACVAAAVIAILSTGCSTIIHGSTQQVRIDSEPHGATVKVDDLAMGTTPVTLELKRKDSHTIQLEKDGYLPYSQSVGQSTSGWFAGNILLGGVIGMLLDYMGGGM